jgi:hypothetical protein
LSSKISGRTDLAAGILLLSLTNSIEVESWEGDKPEPVKYPTLAMTNICKLRKRRSDGTGAFI